MKKEIIFFSNGDPDSASTWSNIPYCFTRTLEDKGLIVKKVNLNVYPWLSDFYDYFIRRIIKLMYMPFGIAPNYASHTRWYQWLGNRVIKKSVEKYKNSDCCIFINYLFYNKYNGIPSLLLSDWPTTFDIQKSGRTPSLMDRRLLNQEAEAINNADNVVSIFSVRAEEMKKDYPHANIHFLGGNVINNLYGKEIDGKEIVKIKSQSKSILFIGKSDRYKESAIKVIESFEILRNEDPHLELNIIGISEHDLGHAPDGVHAYGFLRKDVPEERDKYYELLINAKVLVNPTPRWAAYSSMIEAMYFYTPVVVTPYKEFVAEFGEDIGFGRYNDSYSTDCIIDNIKAVIHNDNYDEMCISAYDNVKYYTWDNYVDKILNLIYQ